MTINKAQGQTIPNIGIYLPEPVFSHGQLYIALSRGVSRSTTWMLAKPNKDIDPGGRRTKNIVFRDILQCRKQNHLYFNAGISLDVHYFILVSMLMDIPETL